MPRGKTSYTVVAVYSHMSSQQVSEKSSSNANSNGASQLRDSTSSDTLASTVSQVAFLQQVISSSGPTEEGAEGDIFEILKQLEAADGVAQGVESKLDKLLENLEGMIEGLEASYHDIFFEEGFTDNYVYYSGCARWSIKRRNGRKET